MLQLPIMASSIDLPPNRDGMFKHLLTMKFHTTPRPPPKGLDLFGQTGIITGGNIGLGLESARILLDHQLSRIILAVRSNKKGEAAASELRKAHPKASIEVWNLDMSSYDSIQAFVKQCSSLDAIDFVILNAALSTAAFNVNLSTGHEESFQVNYLSTVLLTILLLPVLKEHRPKTKPSQLSIVSSGLALSAAFANRDAEPLIASFDDRSWWTMARAVDRYGTTKTLGHLFMSKLKDHVNADDVVVSLVDPGFTKGTALGRDAPLFVKPILWLMHVTLARTLTQGAWTYIDAIAVRGKESHGSFLYNWEIFP